MCSFYFSGLCCRNFLLCIVLIHFCSYTQLSPSAHISHGPLTVSQCMTNTSILAFLLVSDPPILRIEIAFFVLSSALLARPILFSYFISSNFIRNLTSRLSFHCLVSNTISSCFFYNSSKNFIFQISNRQRTTTEDGPT